jgi:alpha-L-rhamnosidase
VTKDWQAKWIWAAGRAVPPSQFVLFRKVINAETERRATLRCAADSKYRLWVNGRHVGTGPARGHAAHPYYDTYRVTLRPGANSIAFRVQHFTNRNVHIFAAVQGGLICQVNAGTTVLAATDATWKAMTCQAYSPIEGLIFPQCFDASREPEDWTAPAHADAGWPAARVRRQSPLAPPERLVARPIPMLGGPSRRPARLLRVGRNTAVNPRAIAADRDIASSLLRAQYAERHAGRDVCSAAGPGPWPRRPLALRVARGESVVVAADFGAETLASIEIAIEGPRGTIVDYGTSECLDDNKVATRWQGLRQSERIILRDGLTRYRTQQTRGCRFLVLRVTPPPGAGAEVVLKDIVAHEEIYPARLRGTFRCSDALLNRIHAMSARTLNLCMEDAFTDCPWRERSQWVGDFQPEALFNAYTFYATDIWRKAVLEFASGSTEDGWVPGIFPTSRPHNLPTWGMRLPVFFRDYVLYTGDTDVLTPCLAAVHRQMAWFARHENRAGLLGNLPGWNFVDWTALDARNRGGGAVQGWYLEALETASWLAAQAGDRPAAAAWSAKARTVREALMRQYWDTSRKAFRKYRARDPERPDDCPPDLVGQHENVLFPLLGVGTARQRRQALDAAAGPSGMYLPDLGGYQGTFAPIPGELARAIVLTEGEPNQQGTYSAQPLHLIGSPFWSFYALRALMEDGRAEAALNYMRTGWGLMLANGDTTCWEMWDRKTSLCHGWSAAPAMILPGCVLGVRPLEPGYRTFIVEPRLGDLEWARGRIPSPHGPITLDLKRRGSTVSGTLRVPQGTCARIRQRGTMRTLAPGAHVLRLG